VKNCLFGDKQQQSFTNSYLNYIAWTISFMYVDYKFINSDLSYQI